jgi:hypothetical protein
MLHGVFVVASFGSIPMRRFANLVSSSSCVIGMGAASLKTSAALVCASFFA